MFFPAFLRLRSLSVSNEYLNLQPVQTGQTAPVFNQSNSHWLINETETELIRSWR
jgi:hypothetical protein